MNKSIGREVFVQNSDIVGKESYNVCLTIIANIKISHLIRVGELKLIKEK